MLKRGGSAEHAQGVQWFFKGEVRAHGWRTPDLRRLAHQLTGEIYQTSGLNFLVAVADNLFSSRVLEEKIFAVLLLERLTAEFGDEHFRLFESWLTRICSWAEHDALVHDLIAPMMVAEPRRVAAVFEWAKSGDRWHRRAACVALIRAARRKQFFPEITRLSNLVLDQLLHDQLDQEDDMVQKGLAWLLRETAKADPKRTLSYLMKIRDRAPRRVLRTACETLNPAERRRVLVRT